MNSKSILYWLLTFLLIYTLWPILKWLIFIVIVLLIALFLYLKSKTKVFTNVKRDIEDDYYDYIQNDDKVNDDVIDVEYKAKDTKEN